MEDTLHNKTQTQDISTPVPEDIKEKDTIVEDLDSKWLRWKCLNCGYVYEGVKELKKCPKCGNENPDLFADIA